MNLETALYHAVHDYGVTRLAAEMGIAESTLQNTANPRILTHQWSLQKIRQVINFTGDKRVVHAFCAEFGGMFMPLGVTPAAGGADLFRHLAVVTKQLGEVAAEVELATADKSISLNDRDRIHQQTFDVHQAVHALDAHVDWLADQAKGTLAVVK